jgi:UDP-glucuronate 4-epimerase
VSQPGRLTLVTGAAGFIGFFVAARLLARGEAVVGLDNVNDYYDPQLKQARLAQLTAQEKFIFERVDVADGAAMQSVFARHHFTHVVHLAAQAGVRYSITHPHVYIDSNLAGFLNVLEAGRARPVEHLVYASSSSVYGANTVLPFSESDRVDRPVSLYAATKRANELMANVYAQQFRIPLTGLRFFTVYGPWGRPDMALFLFTKAILEGRPIDVFNNGQMRRAFTYVDDVTEALERVLLHPPTASADAAPHAVYNIGNHTSVELERYIAAIEAAVGRKAVRNLRPMQPGDVPATYADVDRLANLVGFAPNTPIEDGIGRFVAWYRSFYGV